MRLGLRGLSAGSAEESSCTLICAATSSNSSASDPSDTTTFKRIICHACKLSVEVPCNTAGLDKFQLGNELEPFKAHSSLKNDMTSG